MLAAILSLLSYVPFEWVAKATLALCAFLFVADPFPPLSRLVSLISLVVVALLTRLYKDHCKLSDGGAVNMVDANNNLTATESTETPTNNLTSSQTKKDD